MCKKKIMLKIENKDNPYKFIGSFEKIKDIIKFVDKDNNYIFDIGIERLIKENNCEKIIMDFKLKEIEINENNNIMKIPIEIIKKNININNSEIIYRVDDNLIKVIIKEV